MGKIRSINQQFQYAITQGVAFGQSKHAATPEQRRNKLYSVARTEDLRKISKNLAKYLKSKHPDVRFVRDIRLEHVSGWVEARCIRWSNATLNERLSQLRKLDILCRNTYGGSGWGNCNVKPKEKAHKIRDIAMEPTDYEMLRHSLSKSRSMARYAMEISGRSGLRISECACLRGIDIDTEHWTLFVSREGAKNGRARTLSICPEDREFFANLKAERGPGYICGGVKPNSLNRALRRHMKKLGIAEKYPCTTNHAIRKLFAHNRMEEYRGASALEDDAAEMQAFGKVSVELGHGENRPKLYDTYAGRKK